MRKRLVMLMLVVTIITSGMVSASNQAYAITQDELIQRLQEAGGANPTTGGVGVPAPGYEFGSNYDSYVDSIKQERINVVKSRAAERGLSVQEYLDQTGQSHAAKYFDSVTLTDSPSGTVQETKPQEQHTHSYTEELTKEATCTEVGIKTFTCSCGKSYAEEIPLKEHIYMDKVTKEATCKKPGVITFTCSCGDTYEEELPVTEHEKGVAKTIKEATCIEAGERKVYCKFCGEELETEVIEAKGHTEGEEKIEKEPTMFVKGLKVIRCSDCEEVLYSEELPIQLQNWYFIGGIFIIILIVAVMLITKRKKK